jgi:ketosteroid isomerase-like protein
MAYPSAMPNRATFRVANRTGNRALAALLRSPLHPVASGHVALLTYTGRRSGREYTLPVFYRDKGDRITVAVGWPEAKVWWKNLTGEGARVSLLLRGEHHTGHAVATRHGPQDAVVRIELDRPYRESSTASTTRTVSNSQRGSPDHHERLYRRWLFELWAGDLSVADELVTADFVGHWPHEPAKVRGPAALAEVIGESHGYFDKLSFELELGPIVDGDTVAARWTARGTAQGEELTFHGHDLLRVEAGKFAEYWVISEAPG